MADQHDATRDKTQDAGTRPQRDDQQPAGKNQGGQPSGGHPSPRPTDDPSTAPESGDRKH